MYPKYSKPCNVFLFHDDVSSYCCGKCGWMQESHCGDSRHNGQNFGGILPCSGGPLCINSPEYQHEKRLTDLLDRLEEVVKKLSGL